MYDLSKLTPKERERTERRRENARSLLALMPSTTPEKIAADPASRELFESLREALVQEVENPSPVFVIVRPDGRTVLKW